MQYIELVYFKSHCFNSDLHLFKVYPKVFLFLNIHIEQ